MLIICIIFSLCKYINYNYLFLGVLQLVFTLITLSAAKPNPEPQFGYNYRPPSVPSPTYGGPGISGTTSVIGGGYDHSAGSNLGGNIGITTGGGSLGTFGTSSSFTGGNIGGGTIGGGTVGGIGNIQRHIYVYTAPQEEETFHQQQISGGQAQKHYKIIFIKTPAPASYNSPSIQALAQNQEKTLIYVLSKRPEDIGDISVPTATPTQPSKPEVYFIRYKTQNTASTGTENVGTTSTANIGLQTGSKTGFSTVGTDFVGTSSKYGPPGQSGPY